MSTRHATRIAFVGNFEHHGGSANALYGYVRAAERRGCEVRASALGPVDHVVRSKVPIADEDWVPDRMVFAFETYQFLTPDKVDVVERTIPRSRRIVIDQDGMYSAETRVGADANHPTAESLTAWRALFDSLSDTILQPCLAPTTPGVSSFLYFGFQQPLVAKMANVGKGYDVVYVGNNWYRWQDLVRLCEELEPVRTRINGVAVFGKWWNGEGLVGCEEHTYSDPDLLRAHSVEVYPPVSFHRVERTMGLGRINPIFVRPVLRELGLVTPRMFETFAADTVPLLPQGMKGAEHLYGSRVSPLCPSPGVSTADRILTILDAYREYVELRHEIARSLAEDHSYEVRLDQLLAFGC